MLDLTNKTIAIFDEQLDAEQDKAVQWALEFNGPSISEIDAILLHWYLWCCQEFESHERYADPRTPEQIDADQHAAEWRETYASLP